MVTYKNSSIEQIETLKWVLRHAPIKTWDAAVDGGANVGEWSLLMAERFQTVHAFEPGGMFEAKHGGIVFHDAALLDRECRVSINRKKRNNRGWNVEVDPAGAVRATTIDALRLKSCGLIKLDVEGAEGLALIGAAATIARCAPVIIWETGRASRLRPGLDKRQTAGILQRANYSEIYTMGCDHVWAPR